MQKIPKLPLLAALLAAFFLVRMGEAIPAGIIALIVAFAPLITSLVKNHLGKPGGGKPGGGKPGGGKPGGGKPDGAAAPAGNKMPRAEALAILGLAGNPTHGEIKEAHRRLILKNHPDHGGSPFLAAKIGEAKKVLLGE